MTSKPTIWSLLKSADPAPVKKWLKWHPSQLDEAVAARGAHAVRPLTSEEIAEMVAFHERIGAPEESIKALQALASPSTRVVVTGQQPGLMAGPLLSLYKAMGAVLLARELAKKHPGLTFVPVFWVASEDHDFDEVRRVAWPSAAGLEEFAPVHPDWKPGAMVGPLDAGAMGEALIERIRATTHETEFREALIARIAEVYAAGRTIEEAFCRLLLSLMPGMGLVIVSPLMGWVRRRGAEVLKYEALAEGNTSRIVIERGDALEREGYERQLHRRAGAINAFYIHEGRRHALAIEDGKVSCDLPPGEVADNFCTDSEVLFMLIPDFPERFSANAVTRPLIQDSILPTVAQVIGPGEAAYLAQVEGVYPEFEVFAPVRYPRPMATLIDPAAARLMKKYGLDAAFVLEASEAEIEKRLLGNSALGAFIEKAKGLRASEKAEIEGLGALAPADPAIKGAIEKLLAAIETGHGVLEERALESLRRAGDQTSKDAARLAAILRPKGEPQERVLNPLVPFVLNHGTEWPGRLAERLSIAFDAAPQVFMMSDLLK